MSKDAVNSIEIYLIPFPVLGRVSASLAAPPTWGMLGRVWGLSEVWGLSGLWAMFRVLEVWRVWGALGVWGLWGLWGVWEFEVWGMWGRKRARGGGWCWSLSIMGIGYWRYCWRYGWRQLGWSIVLCLERYKYQHQLYYFSFNHDITFCNKHLHLQDLQSEKKETELDWVSPPSPGCLHHS